MRAHTHVVPIPRYSSFVVAYSNNSRLISFNVLLNHDSAWSNSIKFSISQNEKDETMKRFYREVNSATQIVHENIVEYLDVFQ